MAHLNLRKNTGNMDVEGLNNHYQKMMPTTLQGEKYMVEQDSTPRQEQEKLVSIINR